MDAPGDFYGNQLREFAANGRLDLVVELAESKKVDVNGQHKLNGWTALHWAAKRNHADIVKFLLDRGADPGLLTNNGQRAADLTSDRVSGQLLAASTGLDDATRRSISVDGTSPSIGEPIDPKVGASAPFVPSYLRHPEFPYTDAAESAARLLSTGTRKADASTSVSVAGQPSASRDVVVKVRIADATEKDFIEVDVAPAMSFESLKRKLCEELGVAEQAASVVKMRKLPNTIVRNNRDVARLGDYQELELVFRQPTLVATDQCGSSDSGSCSSKQVP